MLRIVVDGAADMPQEWEQKYQIHIMPLRINFGEETYTQGPSFTREDFYRLVREKRMIPKTSLPSPGQVMDFFRSVASKGDTILSIHVSSKLSGTFSTIQTAAQELADEFQIHVFDSGAGSAAQSFMAREARLLYQTGASLEEITRRLEKIRERVNIIFTLDTLDYAFMNGRINALQNAITSLLKVKPIIMLKEGLLDMTDKVRTRQRSLEYVLNAISQRLGDRLVNVAVVHAADLSTAQAMYQRLCQLLNVKEAIITDLAIPVAANLGPGTIGVVAYPVEED